MSLAPETIFTENSFDRTFYETSNDKAKDYDVVDFSEEVKPPDESDFTPKPYQLDFLRQGIPVTGGVSKVSEAKENNLNYFLNLYKVKDELYQPKRGSVINEVLSDISEAIGIKKNKFKVYIIEDSLPNARWIKGTGVICITTGLLKKTELTRGELTYMMAHEVGHYLMYQPGEKIPDRFKNPLFRQAILKNREARYQSEEYSSEEIGLLITDATGNSVDEALNMAIWLAEYIGESGYVGEQGSRILSPKNKSHPYGASVVSFITRIIESPRFVWKNRQVPSIPWIFNPDGLIKEPKRIKHFDPNLDPLDPETIQKIAIYPIYYVDKITESKLLDEDISISLLYFYLEKKTIRPNKKASKAIKRLTNSIENGDYVAYVYLQALISKLYYDAAKIGVDEAKKRLKWFEKSCKISNDEVMLALISQIKSKEELMTDDFQYNINLLSIDLSLNRVVSAFPRSYMRDQLIGTLLKYPPILKDRDHFIKPDHLEYKKIDFPFNDESLRLDCFKKLMQMLHGTSIVDFSSIVSSIVKNAEFSNDMPMDSDLDIDESSSQDIRRDILNYMIECAGAYDRSELESALAESFDQEFCNIYRRLEIAADKFSDPFLKERILGFARIYFLRHAAAVPVEVWNKNIINIVTKMTKSTERNHLLLLLNEAERWRFKKTLMVFKDIPSPDEPGAYGENITLLNSFGFLNNKALESIYPSGQRMLDRFMVNKFPQKEELSSDDICKAIPRSSPIRDELLNRAYADNVENAHFILDSYWSPTSAYAKAYQISSTWMDSSNGAREDFMNICDITEEFPSLRRRMVIEWVDRFGIKAKDYKFMLKAIYDVDVVDLYKGGIVEKSRKTPILTKGAICIASFASSISRGSYSLLSIQDVGGEEEIVKVQDKFEEEEDYEEILHHAYKDDGVIRYSVHEQYHPLIPENAMFLVKLFYRENSHYEIHRIPFQGGKPMPNIRFQRDATIREGINELSQSKGGEAFSNFMQALGWEEAVIFYEELLLGEKGVMHDPDLFKNIEKVFLEGIALLLQEKDVHLTSIKYVKEGFHTLLTYLPLDIQGQIWARILAGIAQKLSLGEIVREAVRPLGDSVGLKLLQLFHSLTIGVEPILEEATRLALNQTESMTLLKSLQFLGARGINPFERHKWYYNLGQGSVRVAIAGVDGRVEDSAYLLVHAKPSNLKVVFGISRFIDHIIRQGQYFPISASQFITLVEQTDEEIANGFENHELYGETYNWLLGEMSIPKILEKFLNGARLELIKGIPYTALTTEQKKIVALMVIGAALEQFWESEDEQILINPEMHGGNILWDSEGKIASLVDCGLLGYTTIDAVMSLMNVYEGYKSNGLNGALAVLLYQNGIGTLKELKESKKNELLSGLDSIEKQFRAGISPELLLPGLASLVYNSLYKNISPGFDVLFRSLQHLAPYFQYAGGLSSVLGGRFGFGESQEKQSELVKEIELARELIGKQTRVQVILTGVPIGKISMKGKIIPIGVLEENLDPQKVVVDGGPMNGMLICVVEGSRQFVRPKNLRIQIAEKCKNMWITIEEYLLLVSSSKHTALNIDHARCIDQSG
ncbi:hypothetical protein BVX93_01300 [bacterium B13(2017)]|nr:hypothetical protein BVX93_01300 [bacterium B13(2017)]